MARAKFYSTPDFPYHIGARCINKEWFTMSMCDVWNIMEDQLFFLHHAFNVEIHSFVLMSNHYHMIARFPDNNISLAMSWFMRESSRQIAKASGRINQVWGARFHRCLISSYHYYLNTYKYVYRNPVEANSVKNVIDYPYSTLSGLVGKFPLRIPLVNDSLLFESSFYGNLIWLNASLTPENSNAIRIALKKKSFELPKINMRLHPLERDLP